MSLTSAPTRPAVPKISPENFRFLCDAIYKDSGIVLDESKHYLVEARLTPVVRTEGLEGLDSLCNLIRAVSGAKLRARVVEAMTTNETLFFRDVKPFDSLRDVIFPELFERKRAERRIRIWCAACSSGQEPYSIGMLWREAAPAGWDLQILATDLSDDILAKARSGSFLQLEVNRGLPARYLVKYFERVEANWVVKPTVRELIRWEKFNLLDNMRLMGPFDLVFCRNVLIYFDHGTKARIISGIRGRMNRGAYLFLGASETTLNLDETLVRKQVGPSVAYQNPE
jgi:chemotaxis protein methyltransferase CheR